MNHKIVIFDWGGVIESHKKGEYSVNVAINNLIKHFNNAENSRNLVERYYATCIEEGIDKRENRERWFNEVKKQFNLQCSSKEFFDIYINEFDKIEYYKDVVHYAHSLKNKCKIGILSNLGFLDRQRLDKQVNLKQFHYVWLSFELKMRKPNEGIYEIVENDCGIAPQNILFIDDCKENIETAQKRGWNTCNAYGYELEKIKEKVNDFLYK